jgi:hypothetical protein
LPLPPVDRGADLMLAGGSRCALEGPQRTLGWVPVRRRRGLGIATAAPLVPCIGAANRTESTALRLGRGTGCAS